MTGTVIAQLISVIALVFLQRYYFGPEEFATFDLFYWFVAIFASVSAFRLETGIILEQEKPAATLLTNFSLKLTGIISIVGLIAFYIYAPFDNNIKQFTSNYLLVALVPVSIFLLGSLQVFTAWFTRLRKFKLMSGNKIAQNSSVAGSQLLTGVAGIKTFGLIYGRTIGLLVTNLIYFFQYFRAKSPQQELTELNIKDSIKKHNKFIYFTSPSVLIGGLINFLLIDLFIRYFGKTFGGEISVAYRYLGLSLAIISTSFSQVYYSSIASIDSKEKLRNTYTYWLKRLAIISLVLIAAVQIIPNSLVIYVLGDKWSGLLPVTKIMAIWMAIMFVSSSLSYIYIKLGRQKEMLVFDIIHLIIVYVSILLPHKMEYSAIDTLWSFTIGQSCFYIFAIIIAYYFMNKFNSQAEN